MSQHYLTKGVQLPGGICKTDNQSKTLLFKNLNLSGQYIDKKYIAKRYPVTLNVDLHNLDWENPKILIGQNNAHLIISQETIQQNFDSLILSKTRLGWTIHGCAETDEYQKTQVTQISATICEENCEKDLHDAVKNYFSLDNVCKSNIKDAVPTKMEQDAISKLQKSIKYIDNQYKINLP